MSQTYYELYSKSNIKSLNRSFNNACKNNDLDKVKYLLNSSDLILRPEIHNDNYAGLESASWNGNIEVVKYLLINYDSSEKKLSNLALRKAASNNQYGMMSFLLNSEEIPVKANLQEQINTIFLECLYQRKMDMMKHLIFNLNIKNTPLIEKALTSVTNPITPEVKSWFKNQELQNSLTNELEIKENNSKKRTKI